MCFMSAARSSAATSMRFMRIIALSARLARRSPIQSVDRRGAERWAGPFESNPRFLDNRAEVFLSLVMFDTVTSANFYIFAIPAITLFGLSKGGLSALGALGLPILSLAISPVKAAAITLPVLIVQDWIGIWSFRREFDRRNLIILTPAALLGVAGAGFFAAHVDEAAVRLLVGCISLAFVAFTLIRDRLRDRLPAAANVLPGAFWGALSGFTSSISHAGGPAFLVYVMPQKLKPNIFAGTSVIFFAIVNVLKLPSYFLLGQFSAENLLASAALMPFGVAATYVGVRMMRRVPADYFYNIILVLSFLLGAKLVFDSLRSGLF
jgi:uncharacterized membrane protein YfcA